MNNKTKIINFIFAVSLLLIPVSSLAIDIPAAPAGGKTIKDIFSAILTPVWEVTFAVAVIMVISSGIMFMTANGEPNKITQARQALIWAIIGLAVATLAFSLQTVVGFLGGGAPGGGGGGGA
jgi:FtsH-binding integral membrane protein